MTRLFPIGAVLLMATVTVAAQAGDARPVSSPVQLTSPRADIASFFGLTPQFAISPDGQQFVFVANPPERSQLLWIRSLASAVVRPLPGTEQASYPFWSADGQFVGFFAAGKLKTIPVAGGTATIVCDAPTGRGGAWNRDGLIVYASGIGDPLRSVPAAGGTPAAVTTVDTSRENSHRWPQFLPGGRHVLFWAGAGTGPPLIKIVSLDSTDVTTFGPADANAAFGGGHVFYKTGNTLMAQAFDAITLTRSGSPVEVVAPISTDAGSAFASFSVSMSGTIIYTRGSARPLVLTWFDRAGKAIGTLGDLGQYTNVTLSPGGERSAVSLTAGSPPNRDVWVLDITDLVPAVRVTTDPAVDATPVWSPDGTELAFSSQRDGPYQIYRRRLGAGTTDERLLKENAPSIATDWSSDGRFIAYTRTGATTGLDIWVLPLSDRSPTAFLQTPAIEDNGAFSPNARWLAYQSNESGRDEIYVRPFPAGGTAVQVSQNGGTQPRWTSKSNELFFLAPDGAVMSAPVTATTSFNAGPPEQILPAAMTLVIRHAYSVSADGQRFLVPVLDQSNPPTITVVPNWTPPGK